MNSKLNTILFDLDGTLVDTNEIIIQSYQHAYSTHLPHKQPDRETIIDEIGPPLRTIFKRYTDDSDLVDKLIETYLEHYTKHEHDLFYLYPGVESTLEKLKKAGYNLAIVTSKYLTSAEPSIEHFNLRKYFDVIVTLGDVQHPKPAAEPVQKALEHFDNVGKAIMIGDNDSDIVSGQNAGVLSAGVAWSIKGEAFLRQAKPNYMLKEMDDIFKIIELESRG